MQLLKRTILLLRYYQVLHHHHSEGVRPVTLNVLLPLYLLSIPMKILPLWCEFVRLRLSEKTPIDLLNHLQNHLPNHLRVMHLGAFHQIFDNFIYLAIGTGKTNFHGKLRFPAGITAFIIEAIKRMIGQPITRQQ